MLKQTIFWNILGRTSYCFVNHLVLNFFHSIFRRQLLTAPIVDDTSFD